MDILSSLWLAVGDISTLFFGPDLRLFPLFLIATVGLCYVIYLWSRPGSGFLAWLFPKDIYTHKSNLVDLKLFVAGRILNGLGVFNAIAASSFSAYLTMELVGGSQAELSMMHPIFIGILLVLVNDFGIYWTHRLHHEMPSLWPFHSVHHSAEIMTPVTVYRKHPVYDVFSTIIRTLLYGILQGLLMALFIGKVEFAVIAGTNAIYFLFNLFGSNLRHSHVWLSYGRVLEHIFISPAQHQIHHSMATRHWNKNYGEVFAIWDWMFGTLYVPQSHEEIRFGIEGLTGDNQPHKTLKDALLLPIQESLETLNPGKPRTAKADSSQSAGSDV